ncbi:hypothetical protein [Bordetella sp. 15P40C-2]|uniref:hypothetical protein n=1 Tax=Bordetella sp. 15P40C-2 TaxID=2572246 RepID=UPI0013279C47|nr:hypothetical protein [Bordetella sp. 15P40C-2]MVW71013.1 hypothetical protein [Bordetella sp. 15P40C-2]
MTKIDHQAEKQTLLAKMELDRAQLADALVHPTPETKTTKGWASTAALAAGAAVGWPRFLRKPLRAMALVAVRQRVAEILNRRNQVREVPDDPEMQRVAQLAADLRHAMAQAERPEDVERVRRELDEQVQRVRELRAREAEALAKEAEAQTREAQATRMAAQTEALHAEHSRVQAKKARLQAEAERAEAVQEEAARVKAQAAAQAEEAAKMHKAAKAEAAAQAQAERARALQQADEAGRVEAEVLRASPPATGTAVTPNAPPHADVAPLRSASSRTVDPISGDPAKEPPSDYSANR